MSVTQTYACILTYIINRLYDILVHKHITIYHEKSVTYSYACILTYIISGVYNIRIAINRAADNDYTQLFLLVMRSIIRLCFAL